MNSPPIGGGSEDPPRLLVIAYRSYKPTSGQRAAIPIWSGSCGSDSGGNRHAILMVRVDHGATVATLEPIVFASVIDLVGAGLIDARLAIRRPGQLQDRAHSHARSWML